LIPVCEIIVVVITINIIVIKKAKKSREELAGLLLIIISFTLVPFQEVQLEESQKTEEYNWK
jgi:TctA family transporter